MSKLTKSKMSRYIFLFLFGFVCVNIFILPNLFSTTNKHKNIRQYNSIQQLPWTYEMESFCFKVQQRIEEERKDEQTSLLLQSNIQLKSPDLNNDTRQQSTEISYHYSTWRSSPHLPRRLSPCDHCIYTELLIILDDFFRRHSILYMMMDGTLLGSYTHHDFLPWDDDVDLRVSIRDRQVIYTFLHQELGHAIKMSNITDEYGNYDKFYFPWSPPAGEKNWSYPYVDIFYFDENSTHIWRANYASVLINDCSMSKSDVFPLVWRPLGRIWLPAPREPLVVFELLRWTSIGKLYYAKTYSHKHERSIRSIGGSAQPYQLYPYYPWVQRYCFGMYCTEQLITTYNKINMTIHSVHFEQYRIDPFFDPKLENKRCWL